MKKVLIIVAGLQFGGVERFSANICKYAPKNEFQIDYLIFEGLGDVYASEIKENGGKVYTISSPHVSYFQYVKNLGNLIDKNHYDVVHSHTQFNSGINMWVAKKHGVPVRIAHSHTTAHENRISFKQKFYEYFMRKLIVRYSTHYCACGVEAGKWMYGDKPFTVINNGIDTDAFRYSSEHRTRIRLQYGISADAFVIGHSGTLSKLKNQDFLIRMMPEILKNKPNALLMCLGTGNEEFRQHLLQIAKELGVSDKVMLPGAVTNVNEHLSAFDVFAFPSLREGTPIALLEAQANGLPCIISDAIPNDACITDLVEKLPTDDMSIWIRKICESRRYIPKNYTTVIDDIGFGIHSSMKPLFSIYRGK